MIYFQNHSKYKSLLTLFLVLSSTQLWAQTDSLKVEINGLLKPHLASTHHSGLFSSRMTQNFKIRASTAVQLHLEMQSGNVFQAPVQSFLPENQMVRERFADQTWYFRVFDFVDQETTPAQIMDIVIDAVY